jgi:hypothetical protein
VTVCSVTYVVAPVVDAEGMPQTLCLQFILLLAAVDAELIVLDLLGAAPASALEVERPWTACKHFARVVLETPFQREGSG